MTDKTKPKRIQRSVRHMKLLKQKLGQIINCTAAFQIKINDLICDIDELLQDVEEEQKLE